MLEGAEEAEAAEASLESRRIWGPVCGEQTDAIGAAAAVVRVRVSVLRRPSSVALNLHVLHVLSELSSYLEPRSVMAVHLTCKHARGNVDLLVQVNRQIVQQLWFWKNNVSVTPLSGLDITLTIKWSAFERDPRSVKFDQDLLLQYSRMPHEAATPDDAWVVKKIRFSGSSGEERYRHLCYMQPHTHAGTSTTSSHTRTQAPLLPATTHARSLYFSNSEFHLWAGPYRLTDTSTPPRKWSVPNKVERPQQSGAYGDYMGGVKVKASGFTIQRGTFVFRFWGSATTHDPLFAPFSHNPLFAKVDIWYYMEDMEPQATPSRVSSSWFISKKTGHLIMPPTTGYGVDLDYIDPDMFVESPEASIERRRSGHLL